MEYWRISWNQANTRVHVHIDNHPSSSGRAGAVFRWDWHECVYVCFRWWRPSISTCDYTECVWQGRESLARVVVASGEGVGKRRAKGWKETGFIIYPSTQFELFTVCAYDPQVGERAREEVEWGELCPGSVWTQDGSLSPGCHWNVFVFVLIKMVLFFPPDNIWLFSKVNNPTLLSMVSLCTSLQIWVNI